MTLTRRATTTTRGGLGARGSACRTVTQRKIQAKTYARLSPMIARVPGTPEARQRRATLLATPSATRSIRARAATRGSERHAPVLLNAMIYFLPPLGALALAMPLATIKPVDATTTAVVAPFYLGLAAAPGYIYCWASRARAVEVSAGVRWWIRGSLVAALAASVGGMLGSLWMILFIVPAAVTAAVILRLWWNFEARALAGS